MTAGHRVGISADLRGPDGGPIFGTAPLGLLDAADLAWEWLPPLDRVGPDEISGFDALYINAPLVQADAFAATSGRLRVIARHGVGYDSVDVPACTAARVLVTIQPDGIRRPLAIATLTLLLALSQRLVVKDRLTRSGRWRERTLNMGTGLVGRTLGVVGAGNVGRDFLAIVRPFGLRLLVCDPYLERPVPDVEMVDLDALLAASDFVVMLVPLSAATRHMIGAAELARMRPDAFLINVARGPIVDESALIEALRAGRIAGAALDVFEQEPIDPANPLLSMENVIVTPHSLCWTDQCFAGLAESALRSIRAALAGEIPANAINPEAAKT